MKFTVSWVVESGWEAEDAEVILAEVERLVGKGVQDEKYLLKQLRRKFGKGNASTGMRREAVPLAEAIVAESEEEEVNVGKVRVAMDAVLRGPKVIAGAIMPDACPVGGGEASIPVGGVVVTDGAVIPSAHGLDVCCSMRATFFESDLETGELLDRLMESTRFGPGGREREHWVPHEVLDEPVWENPFLKGLERHAAMHLADQGDGNHFAFLGEVRVEDVKALETEGYGELAKVLEGRTLKVLVTHHGSRGMGAHLYGRGLKAAVKQVRKAKLQVPENAAWLERGTEVGEDYWEALQYVGRWTEANHECIHDGFLERIGSDGLASVFNAHNFVWEREGKIVHGKGATPAWRDSEGKRALGLIPMNMASPILLVLGGDNEEFLSFAPHGAGRDRSRRATLRALGVRTPKAPRELVDEVLERDAPGVDVRWYGGRGDVSETPVGYKSPERVIRQIEEFGLAKVVAEILPLGCIMAGEIQGKRREDELTPKQLRQMAHRADRRKGKQAGFGED